MRRFSLLGIITFFCLFFYFYRNSGKFRLALVSAWAAFAIANPFANPPPANAKGFVPNLPESQRARTNRNLPIQGAKKPNNNGSDGGGDDDKGIPQYPEIESVQETEKRIENIDEYIAKMEESSDSEEDQCEATKHVDESYKSNSVLKQITQKTKKNPAAMNDFKHVKEALGEGIDPMQIGYKPTNLGNNFFYIRKPKARVVVKVDPITGNSDIVAIGVRATNKRMGQFAKIVNENFDTKIDINPNAS